MREPSWADEYMWAGYLKFALEADPTITEEDIPRMREEFMAGLKGERQGCTVTPFETGAEQ